MTWRVFKTAVMILKFEQSDLGLHCMPRPVCPKISIITIMPEAPNFLARITSCS